MSAKSLEHILLQARQVFPIHSDSTVILQKLDLQFDEFVDVDDFNEICDGEKIKIIEEPKKSLEASESQSTTSKVYIFVMPSG